MTVIKPGSFFWKTNDSERNDQIRNYAFRCLQKSGHYVKLRKRFKGKKKQYMTERSAFEGTPEGLAIRLRETLIKSDILPPHQHL